MRFDVVTYMDIYGNVVTYTYMYMHGNFVTYMYMYGNSGKVHVVPVHHQLI